MLVSASKVSRLELAIDAVPVAVNAPLPAVPVPFKLMASLLARARPFRSKVPPLTVVAPLAVPRLAAVVMLSVPPLIEVAPA